ncbi:TPA: MvaI/BcnI family restriction endonuclease [Legionella pneumophila]|uniref:MvaI/BcnI family restriction endonuclease n=1 Tax=Legionella pneumophila TaxID=446 RepID=UPI0006796F8A|nr:MvaI/BcnI family restriction endonuclease [Legionella pneumophila]HAT9519124.1 MvaI/BcnI restriction endonuclease family protein [Legionella pneumophila subsp. pneumophila]MCK1859647.1 MvaI/BcnI restriction endonuclease family protein [Legionella pneumophila]HAT2106137.1 MvaI/BcnI restriction endonuclease family protein [Legionella pneumophila]HAT9587146.1 MvaI/BcnI restriction endonuclease family protein [Legionella pneumophila subsp. pneumophila]HAT9813777.1 MvaI/BcnI restriction endonucl
MIDSLEKLITLMKAHGAQRMYAKLLSANDNSKNQIYLGSNYTTLNIIPNYGVHADTTINKQGSVRERFKADINFNWIDENGIHHAPDAQLILYPKYPEVRLSGILRGCAKAPSEIIAPRMENRILFFGVSNDRKILAFAVDGDSPVTKEFHSTIFQYNKTGVFLEILFDGLDAKQAKNMLVRKLAEIHKKGWIDSKRLTSSGVCVECKSSNCGGYTLEAELQICPNSKSAPDYLGWEVKQYNVKSFDKFKSSNPVTLMTPEPKAGYYRENGVINFVRKYGYIDKKGREDRLNFGGIHKFNRRCDLTGLTMKLVGFNADTLKIEDVNGGIYLFDDNHQTAAVWKYEDLITHWNHKHAKCVYVPSLCQKEPVQKYWYGNIIQLAEGTDFEMFLKAVVCDKVYYDPGIKIEGASSLNPRPKKRSQFRMRTSDVFSLYYSVENLNLQSLDFTDVS